MKSRLILLATLLISIFSFSQTGDPKVDKMLKELQEQQKAPGKISFTLNGKKTEDLASFIVIEKKGFAISSSLILDKTPESHINFLVPTKKTGTYFLEKNDSGTLMLNNKVYQIKGNVNLKITGKKVSGTFSGEIYEVLKNKSKPAEKSSGKIFGSFNS